MKALIICAGWTGPSLSAYRINHYCSICWWTENAQIRLHGYWAGPILSANCIRALFVHCTSYSHSSRYGNNWGDSLGQFLFFAPKHWTWRTRTSIMRVDSRELPLSAIPLCQLLLCHIAIYAIFSDQSFNDTLTNDNVSFEQLGPDFGAKNKKKIHLLNTPFIWTYITM